MLVLEFERGRGAMLFDPDGRPIGRIVLTKHCQPGHIAVGFAGFEGIRIIRDKLVNSTVQAAFDGKVRPRS